MKIGLFSLNCASEKKIPLFEDRDVFAEDPEYFVEMTQEDFRDRNTFSLFASVPTKYTLLAITDLNGKNTKQNLQIRLFKQDSNPPLVKDQLVAAKLRATRPDSGFEVGRIPMLPKGVAKNTFKNKVKLTATRGVSRVPFVPYGFTKGAVWIKMNEPMPILFVNMHLPMKKKEANLGLPLRIKALEKILSDLKPLIDEKTTILIGGDLNFRIAPQENGTGQNQLNSLLKNERFTDLQELPVKPEDKLFTCKFRQPISEEKRRLAKRFGKKVDPDPAANCATRRGLVKVPNNVTLKKTAQTLQANCGALNRFPSRCDRFLYHVGQGVELQTLLNKGFPFFPESDHNAIYATISLLSSANQKPFAKIPNVVGIEEDGEEGDQEEENDFEGNNTWSNNNNNTDPRSVATSLPPSPVPSLSPPPSPTFVSDLNPMFASRVIQRDPSLNPSIKRVGSQSRMSFAPLATQGVKLNAKGYFNPAP